MASLLQFPDALLRPEVYPDRPGEVELIETHISWVFLTRRHVYKLKKPVRFEFLDFSTEQRRRAACEDEVRLNRRLAPDVYLGVVPITELGSKDLVVGGVGKPIDWLVKMRRLPAERCLAHLITRREVRETDIRAVSQCLLGFYSGLPPVTWESGLYRRRLQQHIDGNRRDMLQLAEFLDGDAVQQADGALRRTVWLESELFDDRVRDGRIVEGHGDLRPEHIFVMPRPSVIDCIEFSTEYRQLDVLDELSFLAVECGVLGATSIGGRVIDEYLRGSGDSPPASLLPFYMCYRACVRAKVLALRAQQEQDADLRRATGQQAVKYLDFARHYASEIGPPLLAVVRGVSGSGKTTLAGELAERVGAAHLSTDTIRLELFGPSAAETNGRYGVQQRRAVYEEMERRAGELLGRGRQVVMDGTFLDAGLRQRVQLLARHYDAVPVFLHCQCPDDEARRRVAVRTSAATSDSEARPALIEQQRQAEEPDPQGVVSWPLNTEESLPMLLEEVRRVLRESLSGAPSPLKVDLR